MTQYAKATASWSTVEGTLRVHCSYCDRSTVHSVAAAHHQSTLNGTVSYETYVAGLKESGCVRLGNMFNSKWE